MRPERFNIRVYGIMFNEAAEVLLVHETINDFYFSKFPGGGLELGEGLKEGLIREFREELNIDIHVKEHVYTTDYFQPSAFKKTDQLIAVYYLVEQTGIPRWDFEESVAIVDGKTETMRFEWVPLQKFRPELLSFPVDKLVCKQILDRYL